MDKFCASVWEKLPADHFELFDAAAIFRPLLFLVKLKSHTGQFIDHTLCATVGCEGSPTQSNGFEGDRRGGRLKLRTSCHDCNSALDAPTHVWEWWCEIRLKVPAWFEIANLVLIQPSSAIAERTLLSSRRHLNSRTLTIRMRLQAAPWHYSINNRSSDFIDSPLSPAPGLDREIAPR